MTEDLTPEEIRHAVDRAVQDFLASAGVEAPPVDAMGLARRHLGPEAVRPGGARPVAAVNGDLTEEQRQWLAARRLGEYHKPAILHRLGPSPEFRGLGGASLVNLFAAGLLLPAGWFAADARALGHDVAALAQRYSTAGIERVAWRLLDIAEPCIITVVDNGHVVHRRSNAWRVRRALEPPERDCQQYVHQQSRPRVVRSQGWTIQGWPVPRPDGQREVLRSVPADEFGP
jgi:hypothetical protein